MVKRSFLTMCVFLGSLGAILLGPGGTQADQQDTAIEASAGYVAWSYDYPGCWYEYASGYCAYPTVEVQAEATVEPVTEEPAETTVSCDTYETEDYGYLAKDYGYQWEYEDYDSAYEDDLWSELITDSQAESAGTEQDDSIAVEEAVVAAVESNVSTWAEDYDYWAEYYDEAYRCYEATVRPTYEPAEVPAEENDATIEEVVAETTGVDTAAEEIEAAEASETPASDSAMDWQHECQDHFDFDYSYCYEYGYGYGYEEGLTFEPITSIDPIETTEATEEVAEVIEQADTCYEDYHYYGDCYYYSYYGSYYGSYYRDDVQSGHADRESSEVVEMDSPALHQAAVLSLARSLDRMGSALKMLSHQLTDMVAPEVATRASTATDKH